MIGYQKTGQLGKKKKTTTQNNKTANRELKKLKIEKDIRHCELCPTQAVSNAHRYPRVWYRGKPTFLYAYYQVLFLCIKCHTKMDDRSRTTEKEKEQIFIKLRGL